MLVFLLEVGAAISGFVFRKNISKGFSSGLQKSMRNYGHGDFKDRNLDSMQTNVSFKFLTQNYTIVNLPNHICTNVSLFSSAAAVLTITPIGFQPHGLSMKILSQKAAVRTPPSASR